MSKFKLVATETLPRELLEYLDSNDFAEMLLARVLGRYMGINRPWEKPAEHFVQRLDPAIEVDGRWGLELTLSKISVRDGRNFAGALREMQDILTEVVERFIPKDMRAQIFCVIATDIPVLGTNSTLYEMHEAVWAEGKRAPISALPQPQR